MAKKVLKKIITESVDLSPYMELNDDLGWLCNIRGINSLMRTCKTYTTMGYIYVDWAVDHENPCVFHLKFEIGKI